MNNWNDAVYRDEPFLQVKDWVALIALALIGVNLNQLPYNNTVSILIQVFLLGLVFFLYRKRPVMIMVAYILLTILPLRLYAGFNETGQGVYTLNPKICIAFAAFFVTYELVIMKHRYRINLYMLLLVTLMVCSLTWTVSTVSYTYHFWWMCVAYLFLPVLIREDSDVRLVIVSYIAAVDIFCLKVLPIITAKTDMYRGTMNLDPNYAAFFVVISVAFVLAALTHYRTVMPQKMKVLMIASAVLGVITMAAFASRTSFMMLAVLVVIYLLFNRKQIKTVLLAFMGMAAIYIIMSQYGVFDSVLMRFADGNAGTGGGRIPIQMELLKSVYYSDVGRFLFGNGFLTASNFGLGSQAHNSFVSILVGFGIAGILVYSAYLLVMFMVLRSSPYRAFLIIFYLLVLYSFSLEPYHMVEGISIFCLLNGINNLDLPLEIPLEQ